MAGPLRALWVYVWSTLRLGPGLGLVAVQAAVRVAAPARDAGKDSWLSVGLRERPAVAPRVRAPRPLRPTPQVEPRPRFRRRYARNLRITSPAGRFWKRATDVTLCAGACVVAAPVVALLAVALKLTSRGPAFFTQERVGRDGKTFRLLKLRTMVVNAEQRLQEHLATNPAAQMEWETRFKLKKDPRIVPGIGHFLRKSSLDELPQLWNVLRGDMSLVGPRPLPDYHLEAFDPDFRHFRQRIAPGLTGQWQVSERADGDLSSLERLDTQYLLRWNPTLDLKLMLLTVRAVVSRRGAY